MPAMCLENRIMRKRKAIPRGAYTPGIELEDSGEGTNIKSQQQAVPVMMMPQPMGEEDEINLLDLWRTLMRRKRIVLAVTSLAVVAGLVYALLAAPVYRAESWLLPPSEKNVQGLNVQGYTPESVYKLFIRNLKSRSLRRHYFDAHKLADRLTPEHKSDADINRIFDGFNKMLSVSRDKKNKALVRVSFEGSDADLAAKWVNDVVAEANNATVNILTGDVASKLENSKRNLHEEITARRKLAAKRRSDEINRLTEADKIERENITGKITSIRQKEIKKLTDEIEQLKEHDKVTRNELIRSISALRQKEEKKISDRIQQLKEAIRIASTLGFVDPITIFSSNGEKKAGNTVSAITVSTTPQILYFRGTKALETEMREIERRKKHPDAFIPGLRDLQEKLVLLKVNSRVEILRQRKNDNSFISGLRDLQEKLAKLESVHIDLSRISTMRIDQAAEIPDQRIKPKRKLIVLLALFGGLMLGIFAAFFAEFLAKARQEEAGASA